MSNTNPSTGTVIAATLPVADIGPSPSNPRKRIDEAYLAELADSIRSHGVIQPVTVRPSPAGGDPLYELVVGECRWRAAKIAGLTEIPAFWRELDDKQVLEIQVVENLQRRDVHPIEEAEGYEQLITRHGYRTDELAAKIGKSQAYVYARLKLTALCSAAREAFYAGKLDASTALLIARIPGERLQKKATKEITEEGFDGPMSYRRAFSHIRYNFTVGIEQATFPLHDAELVPAAGSCDACPKRSVNDVVLFSDLGDTDVCTDTACFADKRAARHLQLIALAESRQIPVLQGDEVKTIAPHGIWSINRDRYTRLDDICEDDEKKRTYREILGEAVPVAAVLDFGVTKGNDTLVEVAETTAIAAALEQAGFVPARWDGDDEHEAIERATLAGKAVDLDAERAWRARLRDIVWPKLQANCAWDSNLRDQVLRIAAAGWLRQEVFFNEWPLDMLARWGLVIQDDSDLDQELEKVAAAISDWQTGDVLMFLLDAVSMYEHDSSRYSFLRSPVTTLELAHVAGIDAESLREAPAEPENAPDPTQAAQAPGTDVAIPAEEKENPAPATPANEPATPVKDAWPFPVEKVDRSLPAPNAHGVYADDEAEALRWKSGSKQRITILLLETTAGWIHSLNVNHKRGGFCGPLKTANGTWPSRAAALQAAADQALDACLAPTVNHGYTDKEKKSLREWLTGLAGEAEVSA